MHKKQAFAFPARDEAPPSLPDSSRRVMKLYARAVGEKNDDDDRQTRAIVSLARSSLPSLQSKPGGLGGLL
jgi:hypothetical protein